MDEDYFKILALSQSLIPELQISPAHFLSALESEKKQTPQMKRGTLIHVLFYTPKEVGNLYSMYTGPTKGEGSRSQAADFKEKCKLGKLEAITQKDLDEGNAVVEFLKSDKYVQRIIKGASFEVPIVMEHPDYGVPIKGKLDSLSDEYISDLKTTSCSPDIWMRRGMDAQTYLQAAWYQMLARLRDGIERRFAYIVVDIRPPYQLSIIYPEADLMRLAKKRCDKALLDFEKCFKANKFPRKPTQIIGWSVPNYLRNELDD